MKKPKKLKRQCEGIKPKAWRTQPVRCSFLASVEFEGKHLCKTHLRGAKCQQRKNDPDRLRLMRIDSLRGSIVSMRQRIYKLQESISHASEELAKLTQTK